MRKYIIISILTLITGFNAFAQNCPTNLRFSCTEPNDYCIPDPSITGLTQNDPWYTSHVTSPTCLGSQPRASYIMFQIGSSGDLLIYIQQFHHYDQIECRPDPASGAIDVDFACWGPFPNIFDEADFRQKLCNNTFSLSGGGSTHRPSNGNHSGGTGGYPINSNSSNPNHISIVDCSYDASGTEWCFIPNAQQGDWYLLLICNYSAGTTGQGNPGFFSFTTLHSAASGSNNYTGATNCDLLNCLETNNPIPCEGNPFTIYCTLDASELPSNPQFQWIAPDSTVLGITTTPSYTLVAEANMTGQFEVIVNTNPPRRGFIDVEVQQTPISITASQTAICKGDSIRLTTPYVAEYSNNSYGYCRWFYQSSSSSVISTDTSCLVYPTEDCQYILRVKNGNTECARSDTIQITVNPVPEVSVTAEDTTLCYGESTRLTANCAENVSYRWSPTSSTQATINVNPSATQTYTVTATLREEPGCHKDTSITIKVDNAIRLRAETTPTHCHKPVGSITMHATGGDNNFWFASSPAVVFNDSIASNIGSGSYVVTATDGMACTQSATVEVANVPGPVPCFIFDSNDDVNMVIRNCTQGTDNSYYWYFGDGVTGTETHPVHEYMEPGRYTVTLQVIDEFNCEDSLSQDYVINGPVYIANAFSPNGDGINDVMYVIGKTIQEEEFLWTIYDRHGSLAFISVDPKIGWDGTLPSGKDAQPGVYVYRLKYKDVNGNYFERDGNITLIR